MASDHSAAQFSMDIMNKTKKKNTLEISFRLQSQAPNKEEVLELNLPAKPQFGPFMHKYCDTDFNYMNTAYFFHI